MYPFDWNNGNEYLNQQKNTKELMDKMIPETTVALKIAKKHMDTQEMKDRIVRETIEELTIYFAHNSRSMSYPEMIVPIGVILRKFKKNAKNNNYRKLVALFLELLNKNAEFIIKKRSAIKEKSLKNI